MLNYSSLTHEQVTSDYETALHNLKLDDDGFLHLGNDGVMRSYAPNGTVIDVLCLTNAELLDHTHRLLAGADVKDTLRNNWAGVSGKDALDEHLFNPPNHILPSVFRSDHEAREAHQSRNEAHEVEAGLRGRQSGPDDGPLLCRSAPCTRSFACIVMLCRACEWFETGYTNYAFKMCVV